MKHALFDGTELFSIKRPMRFRNQIDDKNVNGRHVAIDLYNNVNFYKLRNENIVYRKKYFNTLLHSIYDHRMNSSLFFTKL